MPVLEVFFDYICPFCLKGHEDLMPLMPGYPHIELKWRPCEAHPRPESYGPHSDLCMQGLFFAQDAGVDINEYHDRMYRATLKDRADIESIDALCEVVRGLLDIDAFHEALESGKYAEIQRDHNRYAFEENGVWAVPSYRMDGRKLDSVEEVGVSKEQLKAFLDKTGE